MSWPRALAVGCRKRKPSHKIQSLFNSSAVELLEDRRMLAIVAPSLPYLEALSGGVTSYNATTHAFDVVTTMQRVHAPGGQTYTTPPLNFQIHILVDNSGGLIGGTPGADLLLTGDLDVNGDGTVDYFAANGPLLTAEISEFDFLEINASLDLFGFRSFFNVTGGQLTTSGPWEQYFAGRDLSIVDTAEAVANQPSFNNSFESNFSGTAKAVVGPLIPGISLSKTVEAQNCTADIDGTGVVQLSEPNAPVKFIYTVKNTSNLALDITSLVDDSGTPDTGDDIDILANGIFDGGDTDGDGFLDPGETWVYEFTTSLTTLGKYTNVATVVGEAVDIFNEPIVGLAPATSTSTATVFVADPSLSIEKRVNSDNANVPPFDHVLLGSVLNYSYFVTNNGNVILTLPGATFRDDNSTPGNLLDDFTPTAVTALFNNVPYNVGDVNHNNKFEPGESWEFEKLNVIATTTGLRTNIVNIIGRAVDVNGVEITCLDPVPGTDPASIIVDRPDITLTKVAQAENCRADIDGNGTVQLSEQGNDVTFVYTIQNTGTVDLAILLSDDNGPLPDIANVLAAFGATLDGDDGVPGILEVGETWIVTLSRPLTNLGTYINTAKVVGTPVINNQVVEDLGTVTKTDDAEVYVVNTSVTLQKLVNGADADTEASANQVAPNSFATYTYIVSNPGNVGLTLSIFDDSNPLSDIANVLTFPGVTIINDGGTPNVLDPGETWIIIIQRQLGGPGLYFNEATVTATPVDFNGNQITCLPVSTATDPAYIRVVAEAPIPSSISGYVYEDCNNNGIREPGEEPFEFVQIFITGTNANGAYADSTFTDQFGFYSFNNLLPGTYTITEQNQNLQPLPGDKFDGIDTIGTINGNPVGTPGNDVFTNIVLPAGAAGVNYNFGEIGPSSLCGYVYADTNNNGNIDPGELPIEGVKIHLTGKDYLGNDVDETVYTDQNGYYVFDMLLPSDEGGYKIRETQPIIYVDGKDTLGTAGGQKGNDVFFCIVLEGCTEGCDYNFGEFSLKVPTKLPFIFSNGEWHNPTNALDVNCDGVVSAADVVAVVNMYKTLGLGHLPHHNDVGQYVDVDGDEELTPKDVLTIVNQLRLNNHKPSGDNNHPKMSAADAVFSQIADEDHDTFVSTSTASTSAATTTTTTASTTTYASQNVAVSVGLDLSSGKKDKPTSSSGSILGLITTRIS